MAQYLISRNPDAKAWALEYALIYLEESEAEGVRGDGAWIQSCIETGNFKFSGGTAVTFDQNNFCGLGVTQKGMRGNSFTTPRAGIRAQIQHLKGYATSAPLNNICLDPRYKYITPKGNAPCFEYLAGKWAVPGYDTRKASSLEDAMSKKIGYGFDIIAGVNEMKEIEVSGNTQTEVTNPVNLNIQTLLANSSNHGGTRNASSIRYLIYHYTANKTDRARSNATYFKNNVVKASAHYFVDENDIYQSVEDLKIAYSVGGAKWSDCHLTGGGSMYGRITNTNSISIEMCSTNGMISEATLQNAIQLGKELLKKYNIPISNVYRHFDVNGKHCPGWSGWYGKDSSKWIDLKNRLQGNVIYPVQTNTSAGTNPNTYQVKLLDDLNIRKSPNGTIVQTNGAKKGIIYTIIETQGNWGRLKSGAGWISVADKYVKRV